jgi:hypothetical protein
MRDTTLVNKLVFPNIKRLATQPSTSVQCSLLIPLCLLHPAKGECDYTFLPGTRQGVLILYAGIGTIGKTIIGLIAIRRSWP